MDNNTDQTQQDAEDILSGAPQFSGLPDIRDMINNGDLQSEPKLSDDGESEAEGSESIESPEIPEGQGTPETPEKEEKETTSKNIEEVNILSSAIKMMNKYAQLIEQDDPTNSKAARSIISVLGELLKSEHYDVEQEQEGIGKITS